jgi:hypothetical protein
VLCDSTLETGVALAMARSEVRAALDDYRRMFPSGVQQPRWSSTVEPVVDAIAAGVLILAGAVGLVLLIACANMARSHLTNARRQSQL